MHFISESAAQAAGVWFTRVGVALRFGVAGLLLSTAACLDPVVPTCVGSIDLELSSDDILVGQIFDATASHRIQQCLTSLSWTVTSELELVVAEENSASFRGLRSGDALISVRSTQGNTGGIRVTINEPEGGAGRLIAGRH